jgi:predicted dehydrogenase
MNFAVIGCGMLAQSAHIPNIAQSSRMRLQVCCDLSEEALAVCRDRFGAARTTRDYRDAIRDPEVQAICIATQEKLRLPVIRAAAEAGKPVYCEKPIATTLAEAREIQRVVHAAGIPFCVGHNRRCSPAMRDAYRIFRRHMAAPNPCPWRFDREGAARPRLDGDGVAGMSVRINDDWYSWKGWALDKTQAPHGPMLFEMTHFTDVCNWFLAAEPEEVVALEHGVFNEGVVIRYRTGELATISMHANGTFGYPKELYEMFGNGGAVIVDHMVEVRTAGIPDAPPRIDYPVPDDRFPDVGTEGGMAGWLAKTRAAAEAAGKDGERFLATRPGVDKGHGRALEAFVDEILGRGPQVCGIDDAVRATEVAFAAIRSVQERRAVKLSELES